MVPLIGMIAFGFGFVGFAGWYFWPSSNPRIVSESSVPPGTLQYMQMEFDIKYYKGKKNLDIRPKVDVLNRTDKTLYYKLISVDGSLNGQKITGRAVGVSYGQSLSSISMDMIENVDQSTQTVRGQLTYLLAYSDKPNMYDRKSGRTLIFDYPFVPKKMNVGDTEQRRTGPLVSKDEIEE